MDIQKAYALSVIRNSVKTNADRIRAMTDEELAYFITDQRFAVPNKVADEYGVDITPQYTRGHDNTLAWLKREVDNEKN